MSVERTIRHGNRVSIVMPVFNGEAFIGQAIDSALGQTYTDWELIVVDDGSTDSTARLVAGYKDPRIRYTYQENKGQAAALNRGLSLAEGEFVTTLDADDWLSSDSLACRVDYLAGNADVGVVYGDGVYCLETGERGQRFTELMPSGVTGDVFDTLIVSPFYGTGAAVLVRRSILERNQISYDESISWCQDWDIYIRLAEITRFGFVNAVVVNYRIHGGGMTLTMPSDRRLESLIRLRRKVLSTTRFERVSPAQKAAFFYDYLTRDLIGKAELQGDVLKGAPFVSLSRQERARLIRLTAGSYLYRNEQLQTVKALLRAALKIRPTDLKTLAVFLLVHTNPSVARNMVTKWQDAHRRGTAQESPFAFLHKASAPDGDEVMSRAGAAQC